MKTTLIAVDTGSERRTVDITEAAADFISGVGDGLLSVFVAHATAGLAIIETGAGSDHDLLQALDAALPRDDRWHHQHGSHGHGADHVLPAFLSPSIVVPIVGGEMTLGTWQSIVLVDTNIDNPRRSIRLSFIGDHPGR